MASRDPVQQRRERVSELQNLNGWYGTTLCDGWDDAGSLIAWYEYEQLDGRRATVVESGSSNDPELQRLLAERRQAQPLPSPEPPWWLSPLRVIRALSSWLTAGRAKGR
jgi:hypothetical protein